MTKDLKTNTARHGEETIAAADRLASLSVHMTLSHARAIGLGKEGDFKIAITIGDDVIATFDAAPFTRDLVAVTGAILPDEGSNDDDA